LIKNTNLKNSTLSTIFGFDGRYRSALGLAETKKEELISELLSD